MGIIKGAQDIYIDEDSSLSDAFVCSSVGFLGVKTHLGMDLRLKQRF